MGDVIKDIYFALEDRWYQALDWLDQHHVPVYKVIDPIDTKIPSFALFSGLIALGLIFTFFSFGGLFQGGNVNVTFQVVDAESNPLPNVPIQFSYAGKTETLTSNALGQIELLVASGTKINYEVNVKEYEIIKKSLSPNEDTLEVIQLAALQGQSLTKTLKLVNEVGQPILKEASLTFMCSTAYGSAPNPINGTGGTFTVTPNADCIPLVVNVTVQGYESVQSYPIIAAKDVYNIVMYEKTTKDATIVATVQDTTGAYVAGIDVSIQVNGLIVDNSLTDALGTATFSVAAGDYTVVASDSFNNVYTSAQETVYVASGETVQVSLSVTKNATNTILVTVIDKKTSNPLKDATVKLKQGNTTLHSGFTNSEGKVSIPIADKTLTYTITASKDGYVPQQQSVAGSTTNVAFGLDVATSSTAAKLKVQLIDQDDDPVADAKVVLYNADTGFLSPYEAVVSDSNGIATFNAVVSGNYQAFAYKAGLTGYSEEQFFDITDPDTHFFTIELEIPDGTVYVHVVDMEGNPVPFAKVSVYNAFKNQLLGADLTDTNGSYTLPHNQQKSKADKDVFLVVSKTGYATLTTIQKPVLPETTQSFEIVLPPVDPSGNIEIQLQGVYTTEGKVVTGVGKGKDYVARFRVNVPEEHDELEELVLHVRTGEKDIVEKDEWYIDQVKFPKAIVFKGSSWDPANGLNVDGESATFGPAKWINATLNGANPGVYEFEVELKVRDTAIPQDILKLFYKAFAQNGDILRDPFDANPIDELYAATKSATYQVGVTTSCDDQFCFDASILDIDEGLIEDVTEQYNTQIFKDYRLTFNLLNNGSEFHNNSNLRITSSNEGIDFLTYSIFNADALELEGTVNDHEFKTPLAMGNFTPQKKIGGSITFKPNTAGTTILTIELVSDFESVFRKDIQVNNIGDKELSVTVEPDTFPSNIPLTIQIHAEDAATNEEQVNAQVTLETNLGIVLATKTTDAAGNAEIELPAQLPGKKITLKVQKAEYNPFVQILDVSNQIITLNPATLGITINVKTEAEKNKEFTITNETSLPIIVKSMEVQGNLKGLLDLEKTNSSLQPFVGITISPKSQLEVNLKSVLTPEGLALAQHEDLEAVVAIQIENYGTPWAFELPVKYSLGSTSEVDDPTCFSAAPKSWVTSTDGQTVTYEFSIRNNCAIEGIPTSLQTLAAKANWNGNELGEILLTVFEQNNPTAIGAGKVRPGYFSNLLTNIPAQDELVARLDFTPYGGVKGQGMFDVEIQATNPLEGKPQLLSDKVNAEIAVVNLEDCVIYDKEIMDLVPGKKDTLLIETKGCGSPVDFTLQTELEVSLKQFTLQGTDKKAIEVGDNQLDQGQYPIYVEIEGQENQLATQNKTIRARIRDPNACLQLNRYEFDVYDDPLNEFDGFDTARLDNLCVNQNVQIKLVIEKEFEDSLKKGLFAGFFAFLATGADNWMKDKTFWGKDKAAEVVAAAAAQKQAEGSASKEDESAGKGTLDLPVAAAAAATLKASSDSTQKSALDLPDAPTCPADKGAVVAEAENTIAAAQPLVEAITEADPQAGSEAEEILAQAEAATDSLVSTEDCGDMQTHAITVANAGNSILDIYESVKAGLPQDSTNMEILLSDQPAATNEAGQVLYFAGGVDGLAKSALVTLVVNEEFQDDEEVDGSDNSFLFSYVPTLEGCYDWRIILENDNGSLVGQVDGQFTVGEAAAEECPAPTASGSASPQPIVAILIPTFVPNVPTTNALGGLTLSYPNVVLRNNAKALFDEAGFPNTTGEALGTAFIYLPPGSTFQAQGTQRIFTYMPPVQSIDDVGSPATGFAVLLQTPPQQKEEKSLGDQVGGAIQSSVLGKAMTKVTDFVSLGTNHPMVSFGVTALAVTLIDYFGSDDEEFSMVVLGKDVEINSLSVIAGEKGADETQEDADIGVEESGIALNPKLNLEKPVIGRLESSTLTFTNLTQFLNEVIFRNLLVQGNRFTFTPNREYKNDIPDENDLKPQDTEAFKTKFHLQYNSIPPESLASTAVPPIALSCDTFSEKTGKTGALASPKIAFEWSFSDIGMNACDQGQVDTQGNASHIYCDATQFSIELLQKVQVLKEFIELNAPFECPLQDQLSGTKTQPIPAADIGIASISIDKVGTQDVNIIVGIENKTPVQNNVELSVNYKLEGSTGAGTVLTKDVLVPVGGSKVNIGFVVSGLGNGTYDVTATIDPEECENCSNSTTASDSIDTTFFIGAGSTLVACEPFTTKRLDAFIDATEQAGQGITYPGGFDKEGILELVNFRSHLMQDRFSPDFFTDFDRYAKKVSFFDAPTYYLDQQDGLHRFFTNRTHWIVNREGSPINPAGYLLPGPGIYDVTIDINFDTLEMSFLESGEPDAVVHVFVEKSSTIEETSPFYSLPFNGLIGTDDGQGRVGYGINYSGEKIVVNEDSAELVSTIDIADSTPVASLQTSKVDAYSILNSLERGNILTVTRNSGTALSMKWAPSFATPVMMKVTGNNAQSNVYGYYSIGINGDTAQSYIGAQGNPWYGVGVNCRDFEDKGLLDVFSPRFDTSAINADCALVGPQENISYGFEWCENTMHTGNVHLKTIFYTPQGTLSTIARSAYKDDLSFVGEGISGGSVPLNGTDALPGNTPGDQLSSIEDIIELVKQEAVCVRNSGSKTEFFWNPKEVLNAIETEEKAAEAACIVK